MDTGQRKQLYVITKRPDKVQEAFGPAYAGLPSDLIIIPTDAPEQIPVGGVALCCGDDPLKFFQAQGAIRKACTITSQRLHAIEFAQRRLLFTYSPGIKDIDYAKYIDMLTDFRIACRVAYTGSYAVPVPDTYRYVTDLSEFISRVTQLYQQTGLPVPVAFDTETTGFDYINPDGWIVMMQFCCERNKVDCLHFPSKAAFDSMSAVLKAQIQWILTTPIIKLRGNHLKYDANWIRSKFGFRITNITCDNMLIGSLLDENRSNSLNVLAKLHTAMGGYDDEFSRTVDKAHMEKVHPTTLLPYGGGDADASFQVAEALVPVIAANNGLATLYHRIVHPASRVFERLEYGGVLVSKERFAALEAELKNEIQASVFQARRCLGGILVAKHYDDTKLGGLNPMKASLLTEFMFTPRGLNLKPKMVTEKEQKPSTAIEHLEMFLDHPEAKPFIEAVGLYSSASKVLSTYVYGFMKHLRADGRFHPTYFQFVGDREEGEGGTNTGRRSAKGPAFQTIPKHGKWGKAIRKCYVAPPGYVACERDYSQGELKIAACLAHETTMLEAYKNGLDLHITTAAFVAGLTYEEAMQLKKSMKEEYDALRQLGKAGNFGLLYGMGVDGFMEYARVQYGVSLSRDKAAAFRAGFFSRYPGLLVYHDAYKDFARKNGYVVSPMGRVRHLPLIRSGRRDIQAKAERQAINSPVQSTLGEMMQWSMVLIDACSDLSYVDPFGEIHDAGYDYIPEDKVDVAVPRMREIMENLPFEQVGWKPQLKFTADFKIGPSLGELTEVK